MFERERTKPYVITSQTFLKFAFKSCLLRIPGSINSKYAEQNREVKIIQRWDESRPKANPLYYHFYIYLADRMLKEFNNMQRNNTETHHLKPSI